MKTQDVLPRPMAAACPECGRPAELPRISAEMLFFRCGADAGTMAVMPNETRAVAVDGVVHCITSGELARYRALCRDAAEFMPEAA